LEAEVAKHRFTVEEFRKLGEKKGRRPHTEPRPSDRAPCGASPISEP
jgi:hypothetical protein